MMKEIVVISGKGGTGKTSIAASLISLSKGIVSADCDVDAANLHLVVDHEILKAIPFKGGEKAGIKNEICSSCGRCLELCCFGAISNIDNTFHVDIFACEGCGVCAYFCPEHAIELLEEEGGEWFISDTRSGPMVHARLAPGGENSGKLVTIVRNEAKRIAGEEGYGTILIDGAPGIGCPVIASVTGAYGALIVVEPTLSGLHDMRRVLELLGHFDIKAMIAVNRYDINEKITEEIIEFAASAGAAVAGRVSYDPDVTRAQIGGMSVVEYSDGQAAADMRLLWGAVLDYYDLEV
jgi:MinD superfamily P-loop ATPase